MGTCYRSLGKYVEAKNSYLRTININQNDPISHYNLANLQRVIGNFEESTKHYRFVIKMVE